MLWSVATRARPQQTWGPSESLFCLSAQIFRDMAATGHGVWGQVTHLSLLAMLPGPSWPRAVFLAQNWPSARGGREGEKQPPDCSGLSRVLTLLCKASSLPSPCSPSPRAAELGLGPHFELSLVSTLHFPRRLSFSC
uniref:Uncharacterized protein n=1 Tax=Molossus molossus TaxID=27622 RepID=A0A7J8EF65_MOLMO|nr:hypothetical protein HJG59_008813 [Molossus molossus]